jgi:hypothetical protein
MKSSDAAPGPSSYSTRRATLLADQLERLATQNLHQLAGQIANLDFWISEAEAALDTIDLYPARFRRLRDAQAEWVEAHGTRVVAYCAVCQGACGFGPGKPEPPRRVPSGDLASAAAAVRGAMRRFLLRLYRAGLLDEPAVRGHADRLEIAVEPEDLDRRRERGGQ